VYESDVVVGGQRLFVAGIELHKGVVVAAGPGRRMRRRVPYRLQEGKNADAVWVEDGPETGKIRPMRVKVGDVVEYSFRNAKKFVYAAEELVMVPEQSIYGKTDDSRSHGVLEHKSSDVS
jgi:co-chaperonin GroES (HSP10)